jgi:hypothetical protein
MSTYYRRDDTVQDALGNAISGVDVYYCTQPANTSTNPPSPLATVYSDSTGDAASNPQVTDGFGHAVAYATPGTYTIVYASPTIVTTILEDQEIVAPNQSVAVNAEVPSGTINGTNLVFSLSIAPNPSTSLILYVGGLVQRQGIDYTLSSNIITFTSGAQPHTSGNIFAVYDHV